MVTVRVESDAPSDIGKSFRGTIITRPRKRGSSFSSRRRRRQIRRQAEASALKEKSEREAKSKRELVAKRAGLEVAKLVAEAKKKQARGEKFTKGVVTATAQQKLLFQQQVKKGTLQDIFTSGKSTISKVPLDKAKSQAFFKKTIGAIGQNQDGSFIFAKKAPKEIFNTLGIAPKRKTNAYIRLENKLYREFIRIQKKNVNNRTNKEMALIGLYGLSSTGLQTLRKIPQATWDTIVLILRPDIIIRGIIKLSTSSKSRTDVQRQIEKFGGDLQRADPKAVSTLVSSIAGFKAANKILAETGKVISVTKPVRIIKEALFVRSQPKELKPFIKAILKGARVQENLKPVDLKGLKKISFNEVKELNKIEAKALKLTLQQTDSFVFGSLPARILSKGKTKIPKDVDLATKNIKQFQEKFIKNLPSKIRKNYLIGKEFIKKGGVKILDIKDYSRLRPDQTIFGTGRLPISAIVYSSQGKKLLKTSGLKLPTKSLIKVEGVKIVGFGEQTTRKALGTLQVILEKGGRRAKDPAAFIESLEVQLAGLQGRIPKAKFVNKFLLKIKAKNLENSLKILKSIKFMKILEKKVPGLNKQFPILDKINKLTIKDKSIISNNVRIKINKIKEKLKPKVIKEKIKPKIQKSKPSIIPKGGKSRIPKGGKSRIPKAPPSRIPKGGKSRIPKGGKSRIPKAPPSRIPSVPPSRIPKGGKSRIPKSPPSRIPSAPPSKIPTAPPGKPLGVPPKEPPKKKKRFTFNSKLPTGTRLKFDVRFKSKGKLKEIRIGLPQNRALKRLSHAIDTSLPRSAELFIVGITKMKDITKVNLSKFRIGKTLRTLKLVEKTKFAIDTKGEKRGLSLARALKPRKRKTKKKKRGKKN